MSETINLPIDINDLVLKEKLSEFEKQLVRCSASFEQLGACLFELNRMYSELPEPVRHYMNITLPGLVTAVIDKDGEIN